MVIATPRFEVMKIQSLILVSYYQRYHSDAILSLEEIFHVKYT